jgi:MoaA/NifB/PqqE/SkfB family radical SAM enzyme
MNFREKLAIELRLILLQHDKNMTYTRNKLSYVQNMYNENYKTLLRRMKEEIKKWGAMSCSQLRRHFYGVIFSKYDLYILYNPIKIQEGYVVEITNLVLKDI